MNEPNACRILERNKMLRLLSFLILLLSLPVAGQQPIVTVPNEPANLGTIKQALVQYHSCHEADCYIPQIDRQIDVAMNFLKQSVATGKPERSWRSSSISMRHRSPIGTSKRTTTSGIYLRTRTGASPCTAQRPSMERCAYSVRLNATTWPCSSLRVVPSPSGKRPQPNLIAAGYDHWEGLYLRPEDHPKMQSVAEYKSGDRAEIAAKGFTMILNVGDQMSDLLGSPQAEHSVKLPNPFYYIP